MQQVDYKNFGISAENSQWRMYIAKLGKFHFYTYLQKSRMFEDLG